jgi:hypothetical protein
MVLAGTEGRFWMLPDMHTHKSIIRSITGMKKNTPS